MDDLTRRDALAAMAAFALMGRAAEAQSGAAQAEVSLADPELAKSKVFRFKVMKATQNSNG